MASKQTVHMNRGQGETSYARNSSFQNAEQNRMRPLIEEAVADLLSSSNSSSRSMVITDLGCSSGPNALAIASIAVDAIRRCLGLQRPPPDLFVLLNDLPDNDFATVVKSLAEFKKNNEHVLAGVVPGSFYGRLFTAESLHLVCSSNSLHWLSEAPEDLKMKSIPAYDVDADVRRERRALVVGAYARQFRKDFMLFLQMRAIELVPGGRMVLSLAGRRSVDFASKFTHAWESVAMILCDMVHMGLIDKEKFDSFYIPIYGPSDEELRQIIQEESSFSIRQMQVPELTSGAYSALITPTRVAYMLRAAFEPIIVQHFGSSEGGEGIMDEFVRTAERRWSLEGSLEEELAQNPRGVLLVSLEKKLDIT
uniref:Jasmonate O-methyltransferase n=1 Tax=Leersia perrieri TaxID=77586 RepID=A0A0D9WPX5_9ORYZ